MLTGLPAPAKARQARAGRCHHARGGLRSVCRQDGSSLQEACVDACMMHTHIHTNTMRAGLGLRTTHDRRTSRLLRHNTLPRCPGCVSTTTAGGSRSAATLCTPVGGTVGTTAVLGRAETAPTSLTGEFAEMAREGHAAVQGHSHAGGDGGGSRRINGTDSPGHEGTEVGQGLLSWWWWSVSSALGRVGVSPDLSRNG